MKVQIWSDIVCPFCYIGKRRYEAALQQFDHKDDIEMEFKSFQLDPNAEKGTDKDLHQSLATKYGVSYEEGKAMNDRMTEQAKEVGLDYHLDHAIPTNTEDAHRLSYYAKQHGKMNQMMERIMHAYFTESLDVGDHETLVKLAGEVGLDQEDTRQILSDGAFKQEVQVDQQQAAQIGVQGVPFFVFNQKYAVSGAQPTETFLEVLEKVWKEENEQSPIQMINNAGEQCTDDNCDI
ncbi:DsbA family oxidoreductase [Aquibacillus sediminis]|uniref:DsbA family oxidoreductase n=1 Tax=Aquibacillus sediminis TaxID=2574734 RepID=UPI00110974DB|nr:DsbA family oxidoreductase [Aquibacillus sediminis]